ncbi:MAG: hypothetical protein R3F31_18345 [Verrucomicrobiales bacterium]
MDELSSEVARMSGGKVAYAEGWRRHSHLGFSAKEIDPLKDALGRHYWIDEAYEQGLED